MRRAHAAAHTQAEPRLGGTAWRRGLEGASRGLRRERRQGLQRNRRVRGQRRPCADGVPTACACEAMSSRQTAFRARPRAAAAAREPWGQRPRPAQPARPACEVGRRAVRVGPEPRSARGPTTAGLRRLAGRANQRRDEADRAVRRPDRAVWRAHRAARRPDRPGPPGRARPSLHAARAGYTSSVEPSPPPSHPDTRHSTLDTQHSSVEC